MLTSRRRQTNSDSLGNTFQMPNKYFWPPKPVFPLRNSWKKWMQPSGDIYMHSTVRFLAVRRITLKD